MVHLDVPLVYQSISEDEHSRQELAAREAALVRFPSSSPSLKQRQQPTPRAMVTISDMELAAAVLDIVPLLDLEVVTIRIVMQKLAAHFGVDYKDMLEHKPAIKKLVMSNLGADDEYEKENVAAKRARKSNRISDDDEDEEGEEEDEEEDAEEQEEEEEQASDDSESDAPKKRRRSSVRGARLQSMRC